MLQLKSSPMTFPDSFLPCLVVLVIHGRIHPLLSRRFVTQHLRFEAFHAYMFDVSWSYDSLSRFYIS